MVRKGRRLSIDVGKARIGLAISDFHGILASPLTTVLRLEDLSQTIAEIFGVASVEGDLLEIYIGVPINLDGVSTASTQDALEVATAISEATRVPVALIDERLTTSLANRQLRELGKSQKDARSTIDQMAAVAILEYALSIEKRSGGRPGTDIQTWRLDHE
ncbi:MAG: Holliday junction resolvase RuvX [Actinobacteria bacterium]|nr:Holliday junction resolvase RuvX [Actinomycetota bacterium]